MSLFTSKREKQLWSWAAAVIIAIYATLGLARTLAGLLRERALLDAAFAGGMMLIIAAIILMWIKDRPGWAEFGVWLGIIAAYMMAFIRMAVPEERTHLIEYSIVGALIYAALKERQKQKYDTPSPTALAIIATAIAGLLDECIQAALPSRFFDWRDILFNTLAGFMAVSASAGLTWAQQKKSYEKQSSD